MQDATHKSEIGRKGYLASGGIEYIWSYGDSTWFKPKEMNFKSLNIKPIEKKEMKEYLRKNNDGEYILEVTDEREAQEPHAKHWTEVPKGCDYLISVFGVNSFIDSDMFAKFKTKNVLWSRKPMKEYLDPENGYKLNLTDRPFFDWIEIPEGANFAWKSDGKYVFFTALEMGYRDAAVVWSRHTHPEELPFIDDEPKITTAKGSELDYIAKIHDMRDRYDGESDEDYRYQLEHYISRKEPSLNDQYAEIEKVRRKTYGFTPERAARISLKTEVAYLDISNTLKQRESTYGSFEDVAMITEQMLDVMRKGYYENLAYNQKMALYMICSKMARIVNGNPNHKDSWHDIAGYATLIDNEIESEKDMPF